MKFVTLYLKFDSKEDCYEKMKEFRKKITEPDGKEMEFWSLEDADFDEVGVIYKRTGKTKTDEDGLEVPIFEKLDGWHLNVLCRSEEVAEKIKAVVGDNIVEPKTPNRVFA